MGFSMWELHLPTSFSRLCLRSRSHRPVSWGSKKRLGRVSQISPTRFRSKARSAVAFECVDIQDVSIALLRKDSRHGKVNLKPFLPGLRLGISQSANDAGLAKSAGAV
jgi:hypothetical protein